MHVLVHGSGLIVTEAIENWIAARLQAALSQHESRLVGVDVRLRDLNGPRHGGPADMECGVLVRMLASGSLVVKEHAYDLYVAISRAADRLKNSVGRRLARTNRRRGFAGRGSRGTIL